MSATATKRAAATGTQPDAPFPLDSFRDAAIHLRRPFTPAAVKFKVQATWPKENPTGGLIVAYIDARLVVERLNLIVPHRWHDEYLPVDHKQLLSCALTIDGITRHDIGEGVGKGLYSDALKRAAVKFGIGVSLYAIPKMILSTADSHLKQRQTREGKTLEITPAGERQLRSLYAKWLAEHGSKSFGDPLDHGDLAGAQGDAEIDGATTVPVDAPAPEMPLGPAYNKDVTGKVVAAACMKLAGNNQQKGITLFKLIRKDCDGYMPEAAARALIRIAESDDLVPDVEAPEL